jgi:hypothetical protein
MKVGLANCSRRRSPCRDGLYPGSVTETADPGTQSRDGCRDGLPVIVRTQSSLMAEREPDYADSCFT